MAILLQPLSHEPEPSAPVDVDKKRNPCEPPTFDQQSLTHPSSTVLYLPPLLSSLPPGIEVPPVQTVRPPLATDSHLPHIDPVSVSLHIALHHFSPLSSQYASLSYAEAFNWSELQLPLDEEREWYAVAFRSKRKPGSDSGREYPCGINFLRCLMLPL